MSNLSASGSETGDCERGARRINRASVTASNDKDILVTDSGRIMCARNLGCIVMAVKGRVLDLPVDTRIDVCWDQEGQATAEEGTEFLVVNDALEGARDIPTSQIE